MPSSLSNHLVSGEAFGDGSQVRTGQRPTFNGAPPLPLVLEPDGWPFEEGTPAWSERTALLLFTGRSMQSLRTLHNASSSSLVGAGQTPSSDKGRPGGREFHSIATVLMPVLDSWRS